MKFFSSIQQSFSRCAINSFHTSKLIKKPFSETDILYLHDRFLSNGFQYITAKDIAAGRSIIDTCLTSLNYYQDIACLSVINVYEELLWKGLSTCNIEEYLLDQFYSDFMWIELTSILATEVWFTKFEQLIIDLHIDQHMPIVILAYNKEG